MPIWRERGSRRGDGEEQERPAARADAGSHEAALLQLASLTAGYGPVPVVQDVSLRLGAGEISLVVGPNGAGKSTLVKAVIGELPLLGGQIAFGGEDISRSSEERRSLAGIGYVPQSRDVFPTLTVIENLEVGAYRLRAREARAAIDEMFARFPQLGRLRHRKARQLSGGERKLLAIARGLIANPKLLILDEPTANLAPKIAHTVLEDVVVDLAASGRGILLIEQRVALAAKVAARVTVLVDGKVRYAASGEEFRALPDVAEIFFGSKASAHEGEAMRTS
jgi:branched-chain amino acid transport system ATP-binding protein